MRNSTRVICASHISHACPQRKETLLFLARPELDKYTLAPMTSHIIDLSDGEKMVRASYILIWMPGVFCLNAVYVGLYVCL